MNQDLILYPALGMALLNLSVAMVLFKRRIKAVQEGLNPAYFRFNRGVKLPDHLLTAEQHYQNVHEMPLLFFVLTVLIYLGTEVSLYFLVLGWSYVILRVMHTLVHLRSNNTLWRRNAFVASFIILVLMWLGLCVDFISGK